VQLGALCPERSTFADSGDNVCGFGGEAIMLLMKPLCVYMMQLACFTLALRQVIQIQMRMSLD
jgi:hypothetical protein